MHGQSFPEHLFFRHFDLQQQQSVNEGILMTNKCVVGGLLFMPKFVIKDGIFIMTKCFKGYNKHTLLLKTALNHQCNFKMSNKSVRNMWSFLDAYASALGMCAEHLS